jgi:4-hydroxybenzoate polyprenyltransferase
MRLYIIMRLYIKNNCSVRLECRICVTMAMSIGGFIQSFLRLTRVWNLFIIAFAQYFTAYFLLNQEIWWDWSLHMLVLSTTMIAAGGYVINDYYDVKIDFINKPDRVVVGKSIGRRFAILFHSLLSLGGIGIGFFLSWWVLGIHVISTFLLWWYSNNLKRLPLIGNLMVALLTGMSIAIVEVLYWSSNRLVIIYSLFAFFMTLVREIIKDMEDLKGDNSFGCKTLPIVWGLRKTKVVVYAILSLFSASVIWINYRWVQVPLSYFVVLLFFPLILFVMRLYRADTIRDFSTLSQFCKVIMLLGILSMVIV